MLRRVFLAVLPAVAPAVPATADPLPDWLVDAVAIHGQATITLQATPTFRDPYEGDNSLKPKQSRETVDVTLYAGVRPWAGGELWVNPEVDQGFGLSNTLGVAGFPSAEAYKVGKASPYLRLQRLFFRQTIGLGGDVKQVKGDLNQFAGTRMADRLVVTVGKFGVGDVFDTNRYAHDPRADVLNWALVDAGTFDYAADAWGYSSGIAAEWYTGPWTLRAGLFNLSTIPNGETLERGLRQYQLDGEVERRFTLGGRDGALRVTAFRSRGDFATFTDALALAAAGGGTPDLTSVRRRRSRLGADVNLEQAISEDLGVFARAGVTEGGVEPYDFTDIDRTASAGVQLGGAHWGRAGDKVGVAAVVNGISAEHRRYFAAGGLGVLVGDGRLPHYGAEAIGELYYRWAPAEAFSLTLDYQLVGNPGYNHDRGPVNVMGLRAHAQF